MMYLEIDDYKVVHAYFYKEKSNIIVFEVHEFKNKQGLYTVIKDSLLRLTKVL